MDSQEADRDSRSSGGDATDTIADRKVDDNHTAGAECPCRVRSVRRNDCRTAGARDVLYAIDRDRQLPLDYVPHLLFRMVVLVDRGGVGVDLVVDKCHVVGVKETTVPTRQWLRGTQLARVDEGHDARIAGRLAAPSRPLRRSDGYSGTTM